MQKFKWTRLKVKKVEVGYLSPPGSQPPSGLTVYDFVASNSSPNNGSRNTEAAKQDVLILDEMQEANRWARSGLRLFFGWFVWQFTINAVAMVWFSSARGSLPANARLVYGLFIGWNLLGTIGSLLVHKSFHDCDRRVNELIKKLTEHYDAGDTSWKPQSAIPLSAINTVFIFCAVTSFASMAFWTIVFVSRG